MPFRLFLSSIFVLATLLYACNEDEEVSTPNAPVPTSNFGTVELDLTHKVGSDPLIQNTVNYLNVNGDTFTVTRFRYYISNIVLHKSDGSTYAPADSYYLVDDAVNSSKVISIPNVPLGEYTSVSYLLGVDSARNCSGSQTGALDPANGMFWSWSTGYIFMMFEGTSPQSSSSSLVFHVGGFKGPFNAIRTISPSMNGGVLNVRAERKSTIHMVVNLAEMFANPTTLDFATLSTVHSSGANAVIVADNYTDMFRVDHIHND